MTEVEARELLGVRSTTTTAELRAAYREALKRWHPDVFPSGSDSDPEAVRQTQRLNEAYQFLLANPVSLGPKPGWGEAPPRRLEWQTDPHELEPVRGWLGDRDVGSHCRLGSNTRTWCWAGRSAAPPPAKRHDGLFGGKLAHEGEAFPQPRIEGFLGGESLWF